MNILVLSASSKVLLVKAFQAAVKPLGGKVIAADIDASAAAMQAADAAVVTPRSTSPAFVDALLAIAGHFDISLIVPTRDGELRRLSDASDALAAAGVTVLVAPVSSLDICASTRRFSAFCEEFGYPTAKLLEEWPDPSAYPIYCRADDRTIGHAGMKLPNETALSAYRTLHGAVEGGLVIQEYIDEPEYSIDVLMTLDGAPLQAVARRRINLRGGESWQTKVEKLPHLTDMALDLSSRLGLIGHNTLQAFYSPGSGVSFIEANARFGGASNLSIKAGLASPERIVQMASGNAMAAHVPRPLNYGRMLLRHAEDVFVDHDPSEDCLAWQDFLPDDTAKQGGGTVA